MSATDPSQAHLAAGVAEASERRWAIIVGAITVVLVAMMVITGLHWAAMPPSRVETIDARTLHIKGEFVEDNLGTTIEQDGRVTVRVLAQQYSFEPQCIVVPVNRPVMFRGTSSDAIHGFSVETSNANTMLIPGFVATFTTTFPREGEYLMPCHEYCGTGHEAMWARVQVISQQDFLSRLSTARRVSCVRR